MLDKIEKSKKIMSEKDSLIIPKYRRKMVFTTKAFKKELDRRLADARGYRSSLHIFNFILDNHFSLFNEHCRCYTSSSIECYCGDCEYNKHFFDSFEFIIQHFRRARFKKDKVTENENRLVNRYIEKFPEIIKLYSCNIEHDFERVDIIDKFKRYCDLFSFSAGFKTLENMKKDCETNMEGSKIYVKEFLEYIPDAVNMLYRHHNARKIQRWFKNIRYQPAIYPAAMRIELKKLERDGIHLI